MNLGHEFSVLIHFSKVHLSFNGANINKHMFKYGKD